MDALQRLARFVQNAVQARPGEPASAPSSQSAPSTPPAPSTPDAASSQAAADPLPGSPPSDADRKRRRDHTPGFQVNCGTPYTVPHVGIVFVHGIGTQEAGATLLEWSSKIIALLLDARAMQKAKGDPVIDVQLDPSSSSRFIELKLPEARTEDGKGVVREQHWVMTEAWWAERVRPPAFGDMAEWLGPRGAIRRILGAMLPRRSNAHDPRLRRAVHVERLVRDVKQERPLWDAIRQWWHLFRGRDPDSLPEAKTTSVVKEEGELGHVYGDPGPLSLLTGALSDIGTFLVSLGAGLYFQAISALILVLYGALRSVEKVLPIGPLKNGALTRPIDRFVLEWFGDVYILLREPAQAASVRGRLIDALRDLEANRCEPVVVVAHSGGAIVSYMTLTDEAQKDLKVDRLITLGEGLNLAWRLTAAADGVADEETKRRYDRLYSDLFELRPDLSWDDFWASQDPAPVGVLSPEADLLGDASLAKVHSHAVWNRLAFREDHGTYWDNDEEFLIPLARLIDGSPPEQRVFRETDEDRNRSIRRRRRLTFLSIWRQLALVAPTAAIVAAYATGSTYVFDAGKNIADAWGQVPGNELISAPVTAIRNLGLDTQEPWRSLGEAGIWVIVAVLALLTLVALVAPPERPVPWNNRDQGWWHPFNLFSVFLRILPFAVAIPVILSVAYGAGKFMASATPAGTEAGKVVLLAFVITLVVAGVVYLLLFRAPWKDRWLVRRTRDGVQLLVTIVVMTVVATFAVAPFVSVLIFEEVGTTVLGFATVIVAFQVIARIGTWRWGVWDGRERVAVRTSKPYPPLFRILGQMIVLMAIVLIAFTAIVFEPTLTIWAAGGAALAVLLGVGVDVMDAARGERRDPGDAMSGSKISL